jgi:hypothetical protein
MQHFDSSAVPLQAEIKGRNGHRHVLTPSAACKQVKRFCFFVVLVLLA